MFGITSIMEIERSYKRRKNSLVIDTKGDENLVKTQEF